MKTIALHHKTTHKLLITPQLKQALLLLALPFLKFKEYLERQIAENPLLQSSSEENLETKINRLLNSKRSDFSFSQAYLNADETGQLQPMETPSLQNLNLQEYLLHQLKMSFLKEEELVIAQELINHIDNNGYLRIPLERFSQDHGFLLDKTENALRAIQELEPFGVGARSLQECLLIQLKNTEKEQTLAYRIVYSCFKELSRKKYDVISKKLNVSLHEVEEAFKQIASLTPKPGSSFSQEENLRIIPDITVKMHKNRACILLKDTELPKLKIASGYKKLLNSPDTPEEIKQFVKERLRSALWLIRSVEQRKQNVLKVFNAVLNIQRQALCKDLSLLKPLNLKDIAKKTNLHLSTVGRIVSNKFISTPYGTIKAKDLFGSKLTLERGGKISGKSVRIKIKEIILNANKPLSDQAISTILCNEGIKISRRTVAKYRNLLRIPPSFLR